MFSHIFVGVSDFERALAFYSPLMSALGLKVRYCERECPWAGWQSIPDPRPHFLLGLGLAYLLAMLVVARRCWFSIPFRGVGFSCVAYAGALVANAA